MSRETPLHRHRGTLAGLIAGIFVPIATFGFGVTIWISLPAAVLIYYGVTLAFSPRGFFEKLPKGDFAEERIKLVRDVLVQADYSLASLAASVEHIRKRDIQERLLHLHRIASDVMSEVERDPKRLMQVQRLLTYYLPSASRLAKGYVALETKRNPQQARITQAEDMVVRLDDIFSDYADRLVMPEVEDLDVELRLLDDALREEELKSS